MEIRPEQLTVEQYAAVQSAFGTKVERVGENYWIRARRVFGRPLLPYEPYSPAATEIPKDVWGGFQHVVTDSSAANSVMGFLMLDDLQNYALAQVSHNRRRLINGAAKKMEIRPVKNLHELQEQGYQAYTAFYQRTGYRYLSSRRRKENFCRWAETLLQEPKALVMGAYGAEGLVAVSVAYWVRETLLYATHFTHTIALRQGATELMFHALREAAAHTPGIQQIYVRRYQGGNSIDQYYLMRGAKLVNKPARLHLHPLMRWGLRVFLPRQYAMLHGEVRTET